MFNSQVPQIIYATSVFVVSLALFVLVYRRGFGVARVKVGGASIEVLARIEEKVDGVVDAVNHSEEGELSLAKRVVRLDKSLDLHTAWVRESLRLLSERLAVALPEYPTDRPAGAKTRASDAPPKSSDSIDGDTGKMPD